MTPTEPTNGTRSGVRALVSPWLWVAVAPLLLAAEDCDGTADGCPTDSRDAAFDIARDLEHCEIADGADGNAPGARYGRFYTITCPARVSAEQAVQVAAALAEDDTRDNPILDDYQPLGLTPRYRYPTFADGGVRDDTRGIRNLGVQECGGGPAVSTVFEAEMGTRAPSSAEVAAQCSIANQGGFIGIDQPFDVEYHCEIHLLAEERNDITGNARNSSDARPPWVERVAFELISTDPGFLPQADNVGGDICLLDATDIQCAPCQTSDKLVVRTVTVDEGASCPAGTVYRL